MANKPIRSPNSSLKTLQQEASPDITIQRPKMRDKNPTNSLAQLERKHNVPPPPKKAGLEAPSRSTSPPFLLPANCVSPPSTTIDDRRATAPGQGARPPKDGRPAAPSPAYYPPQTRILRGAGAATPTQGARHTNTKIATWCFIQSEVGGEGSEIRLALWWERKGREKRERGVVHA